MKQADQEAYEERTKTNRATWPLGPWTDEPDREEWRHESGLPCLMVRNGSGNWCGYVGLPPGHPGYGFGYSSEYEQGEDGEDDYSRRKANPLDDVSVHGGITYAEKCAGVICHVPAPGESDDVWWIGFDTAHSGDFGPLDAKMAQERGGIWSHREHFDTYKGLRYVKGETNKLAEQLAALAARPT